MTRNREPTGDRIRARISGEALRPEELLAADSTADGAAILFVGRVRDHNAGRPVQRLHYEAYQEMAERELQAILVEVAARWDLGRLEAAHRIGTLEPGEVSLVLVVEAPHRAEAYEASRHVIEEIKHRVPIWKREEYADGRREWVQAASARA